MKLPWLSVLMVMCTAPAFANPIPLDTLCDTLAKEQRRVLDAYNASHPKDPVTPEDFEVEGYDLDAFSCERATRGVYGFVVESFEFDRDRFSVKGIYHLVYLSEDGRRMRSGSARFEALGQRGHSASLLLYDFTGDGEEEAVFHQVVDTFDIEGGDTYFITRILSPDDAGLLSIPGRSDDSFPDLSIALHYQLPCGELCAGTDFIGFPLLRHYEDGQYLEHDVNTWRDVDARCPEPSEDLEYFLNPEYGDARRVRHTFERAACARFWGKSADALAYLPKALCEADPVFCPFGSMLETWLAIEPPVTLVGEGLELGDTLERSAFVPGHRWINEVERRQNDWDSSPQDVTYSVAWEVLEVEPVKGGVVVTVEESGGAFDDPSRTLTLEIEDTCIRWLNSKGKLIYETCAKGKDSLIEVEGALRWNHFLKSEKLDIRLDPELGIGTMAFQDSSERFVEYRMVGYALGELQGGDLERKIIHCDWDVSEKPHRDGRARTMALSGLAGAHEMKGKSEEGRTELVIVDASGGELLRYSEPLELKRTKRWREQDGHAEYVLIHAEGPEGSQLRVMMTLVTMSADGIVRRDFKDNPESRWDDTGSSWILADQDDSGQDQCVLLLWFEDKGVRVELEPVTE